MTAVEDPHATWLAIVAEADRMPEGVFAAAVTDTIRRVVRATPGEPLAPRVVADPRGAAELSTACLREWRRRHPGVGAA
ncbi:hypothetical protein [Dactylosporangium sp. CA-139066]|uniref:hypothetical protein n=1 Tax=Dactylosporangium sp. CA-139066 TaxID=3239930 RepID=UPI003D9218B4